MKYYLSAFVALVMATNSFAWSGSVAPVGGKKAVEDPYALTMSSFGLPEDDFEDEETQQAYESISDLLEHKPEQYWFHYVMQFKELYGNGKSLPPNRDETGAAIVAAAALGSMDKSQIIISEKAYETVMAYTGAMISTSLQFGHLDPEEMSEFIASDECEISLGSWWCEVLQQEGFTWKTDDRIKYFYGIPDATFARVGKL